MLKCTEKGVGNFLARVGPDVLNLIFALTVSNDTATVLLLDLGNLLLRTLNERCLLRRYDHVGNADGSPCTGGLAETEFLELVQSFHSPSLADCLVATPYDVTKLLLASNLVVETNLLGQIWLKRTRPTVVSSTVSSEFP